MKMPNKHLKIVVEDHNLEERDLIVVIRRQENSEETKEVCLTDFVPENYNVMEKTTSWETPGFVEYVNDDYTPQDWLDSHSSTELHNLILNELFNKLIS